MKHYTLIPLTLSALTLALACTSSTKNEVKPDGSGGSSTDSSGGSGGSAAGNSSTSADGGSAGASDGGSGGLASGGSQSSGTGGSGSASGGSHAIGGSAGEPGDGGTGGESTSGGTGGGSGGSGGGPVIVDSCGGSESPSNDELDDATPYSLGKDFVGCLQVADDVDVYEFSVPNKPGYVIVSVTNVDETTDIGLVAYAASDQGEFYSPYNLADGGSVFMFFTTKQAASFFVSVESSNTFDGPSEYTFNTTFVELDDPYEPNNLRSEAAPIEVGEPVDAYMFAGWETSSGIPNDEWHDWYEVDLAVGQTSILLSLQASDYDGEVILFDENGIQLQREYNLTDGSSVLLERNIEEAGTYYVRVAPASTHPSTVDDSSNVPQAFTVPYTLTITQ